MNRIILILCLALTSLCADAQTLRQMNDNGNFNSMDADGNTTNNKFNKHNNDTTRNKEIPKGLRVWKIDRKFGDVFPSLPDTMPHLFMNTIFNTGKYGEYNTTGNNYTPRLSRIAADQPLTGQFMFVQPYSHVMKQPEDLLFTNTLSPITNVTYDNCGDKLNGEDHIDVMFATNANKRLGFGFDLNYSYARGYYANQSTSHFGTTLFGSYDGDRYKMHAMFSVYHQKVAENGGITNDDYITHPETFDDQFAENEIPTVLQRNWNRNDNIHLFLTHRYSFGFYRKVRMTDEEIKARRFAAESKKDNAERKKEEEKKRKEEENVKEETLVFSDNKTDETLADSIETALADTLKKEYVPVTSVIHTLDLNNYGRIYQAYDTPADYYAKTYYDLNADNAYRGDSIYDRTRHFSMKNTLAIAMLEGFNKWAKAGLKIFATHELRNFQMPDIIKDGEVEHTVMGKWNEHNISVGGQLIKTQGKTLHYNLAAETWLVGEDAGQIKVDFSTDLNFPLFGDTVSLGAKAYFYRLNPTFYQRHYHSKHIWWDNSLSKETRTRVEGLFTYRKTNTRLRVAVEEIQNYTYFGMSYDATTDCRTNLSAAVYQSGKNINLLTAQVMQDFRLGPLNWENIFTFQSSSQEDVLPVPTINVFTNLYLKFKIAKVLAVEFGADGYWFSKYYAPDYCPQLSQFAIQQTADSRVKIGGYPFIDVYANMHLKHTRFFVMMSHVNGGSGNKQYFLAPHYPSNGRVLRFGLSWNFFN